MSRELIISHGSTRVATDELFAFAAALENVLSQCEELLRSLRQVRVGFHGEAMRRMETLHRNVMRVTDHIVNAEQRIDCARGIAEKLVHNLNEAAENYAHAEQRAVAISRTSSEIGAWVLGRVLGIPILATVFLANMATSALKDTPLVDVGKYINRGIAQWLEEIGITQRYEEVKRNLLSDPAFIAAVRGAISSVDDFEAGFTGTPLIANTIVGDNGLGITGIHTSALTVLGLAGIFGGNAAVKPLTETPVEVRQTLAASIAPPLNVADFVGRIPHPPVDGSQILVERYGSDDNPRWVVYIGGTLDFGLTPTTEPFDSTSNMALMAKGPAGSLRAVYDALNAAGARAGEQVITVGHSQGALVAAKMAEHSPYDVRAVITVGGPTAQIEIPDTIPTLEIVHTDDFIPALGGFPPTSHQFSEERITVRRRMFSSETLPSEDLFPAHNLHNYYETATIVSRSIDPRIHAFEHILRSYVGNTNGVLSQWRADRARLPATSDQMVEK